MILITSAIDEEREGLPESFCSEGFMQKSLGIGYLEAALSLSKVLMQTKVDQIIFLGTAGSYRSNIAIGEVVQVTNAHLLLANSITNQSYTPQSYPSFGLQALDAGANSIKDVDVLSSLEITHDKALADTIYEHHGKEFLLENMELYGIAKVAASFGVACSSLLGVTNYCHASAHQDWKQNNVEVSKMTCKYLRFSELW